MLTQVQPRQFIIHVVRADGKKIFVGLLTITNENGEIRSCHLVTTTGHTQTVLAINGISDSLTSYGLNQPEAMYSDNPESDRQILETAFQSSLLRDVVGVERYGHLEQLNTPDNVVVHVKNTREAIDEACQRIMRDLDFMDADSRVVVGFDTEWNVEFPANGRFQHHGPTAIVQLAYRDTIYIFQVCFISFQSLSRTLTQISRGFGTGWGYGC